MKIEIVWSSQTGTTAKAAIRMGEILEEHGHQVRVQSVTQADPAEVSKADFICVGSWVQGLFIIMQHPTEESMRFINRLGDLTGKDAIVFCTYKIAVGGTLRKMASALESKGARVVGNFQYKGREPDDKFKAFAASLH